MSICAVVCEFNPFHSGHGHLLGECRRLLGEGTAVAAIMSGNFVQRGEPAIFDKFTRAKAALCSGADLVFEMPTSYALSGAEKFCHAGVKIAAGIGAAYLAFGSECGDIDALNRLCDCLSGDDANAIIKEVLSSGVTYAVARETAAKRLLGEKYSSILKNPNDNLALGYITAIKKLRADITPIAIKRVGAGHNDDVVNGGFASGKMIREMVKSGEKIDRFVPENALKIYQKATPMVLSAAGERMIIDRLRQYGADELSQLDDVSEGLHNRIYSAARECGTLTEIFDNAKTKRYTHARIRRLCYCAALGVFSPDFPPYLRLLGFNKTGQGELKNIVSMPLVSSFADACKVSDDAKEYFKNEAKITDFYNMLGRDALPCGDEMTRGIIKI